MTAFIRLRRALLRAGLAATFTLLVLAGCARDAAPPAAAAAVGPRLYILDCGTIVPMDSKLFSLNPGEFKGDGGFVGPCYLIVHPKGTLVWDAGEIQDKDIPDDGSVVTQSVFKASRKLGSQLTALGFPPKDITFIAMSHYHTDHTANANLFAASTWIVQQAEYDIMFSKGEVNIRSPETYKDLENAKRITLQNADHDVFGDGTVIIKTAPGHTPGHQMLFLKLAHFGPLLLAGDLYHFPEEKTLDRVPTFDFDAAMTRETRMKTDAFLAQTGAKMWIQHDPPTNATLKKAPEYYD